VRQFLFKGVAENSKHAAKIMAERSSFGFLEWEYPE